jgi:hypothetical protein
MEKNSTKQLPEPIPWSKMCENGPEILRLKKNTVAHSIPDVNPRKKSSIRQGSKFNMFLLGCNKKKFSHNLK